MNKLAKYIYEDHTNVLATKFSDHDSRQKAMAAMLYEALGLGADYKFEKKSFRRAFRENRAKMYNVIEEIGDQILADGEWIKNSFVNKFVEVRNLALGDKNEFYFEGRNNLVVSEFSGSHYDLRRQRVDNGQSFQVETKDYGIKIYEEFERIASGRVDFGMLVEFVAEAIEKKLSEMAQATFTSALTQLGNTYNVTGSYNEDDILTMLQHVESVNGVKPQIVGTAAAIRKLQGTVDVKWSSNMKDTRNNNGYLPMWNGYECVEISQGHKLGSIKEFIMPVKELYAVTPDVKLVKMVLEGETSIKDVADYQTNADKTIEQALAFKAGVAVAYSGVVGKIELA